MRLYGLQEAGTSSKKGTKDNEPTEGDMKTIATLAAIMVLTACTSVPSDSTASSPTTASAVTGVASRPAPDKPDDNVVTTAKRKQICKNQEDLGSRLKRPRCYDAPDGNENAYRDDLLRDKTDELRQLDESTTIRTTENIFGR